MNNMNNTPIEIGNRLELFIDRYLIESIEGLDLRLQTPREMPAPEHPLAGGYMTVIKDRDVYRGYYRTTKPGYAGEGGDGNPGECTCYSESRDGIEWAKPELNLIRDFEGRFIPNAILDEAPFPHTFSPLLDANPEAAADQRYKALAGLADKWDGLYAFASADGIHWRRISDKAVIPYNKELHGALAFDSQNVAFWSEAEGRYAAYFRHWKNPQGWPYPRTIGRAVSHDFVHWTDESATFQTPNLPDEQLYTNQTHPYFRAPHIYIATPTRFSRGYVRGEPVTDGNGKLRNIGSTDIQFMTSRAGADRYDRTFRETFIRPGLDPVLWESRANYAALNVVPTGPTEMSIYHGKGRRYTLRTDGFASVHAPHTGGELVTKPFVFAGNELALNVSTAIQGGLRIELQNPGGTALEGFAMNDCDRIIGDGIEQVVIWKNGADVGALAGRPVRLKIEIKDANLFAFRFG